MAVNRVVRPAGTPFGARPARVATIAPGNEPAGRDRPAFTRDRHLVGYVGRINGPDRQVRIRDGAAANAILGSISTRGKKQMTALLAIARTSAGGKRPAGRCYKAVWDYLRTSGFGSLLRFGIPGAFSSYARQFAEYLNGSDTANRLGLRRLPLDNPYDAPPGAIVVVRPGTPGTAHPTAGDIAVAAGNGRFYNDGEMRYGPRDIFKPGNDYVLGIYVPE